MTYFAVTREIGIDMGHRVTNHASKCKNLHGHRYRIEATVRGVLSGGGSDEGMVMDFGFLKELLMEYVDGPFDHGLCLWVKDPLAIDLFQHRIIYDPHDQDGLRLHYDSALECAHDYGYIETYVTGYGKVLFMAEVPTAENLAKLWFDILDAHVVRHGPSLSSVRVWETPNCMAEYPVPGP